MSRLDELIAELCPNGVEYRKLGDFASISRGGSFQKKDFAEVGTPCIHYGQIYTRYGLFADTTFSFITDEAASKSRFASQNDIVMAVTSENVVDVCKCVAWLGSDDIAISGHTAIIKHDQNPKYLTYYFHSSMFFTQKVKFANGTKVIEVSPNKLKDILIPIPPLAIQEEIVRILDNFTELSNELSNELSARKKQYEYYHKFLLSFSDDVEWITLGEIGPVRMCKRIMKSETSSTGDVPFFKIGTFGREPDAFITQEKYEEYKNAYSFPKKGDILISAAGTIGRTVIYDGEPAYYQDSNIVWIDNNENRVLNKYLIYCYAMKPWAVSNGGTIARLYNDNISKARIPVPSLEKQEQIVAILDRFDALCNDLASGLPAEIEARRKQYEYYRDKLLTFQEA